MEELDAVHQAMAAELRARLDEQESGRLAQAAEDARGRMEYVDGLGGDTAALLTELDAAHQAMAAEQQQRLAEDRARLASDVAETRGALQADLSEAQRVWSNFATLMQRRRARKAAAPPPPPVEEAPPPPVEEAVAPPVEAPPEAEEVTPDDLTAIRGIGSAMQGHLNEAEIYTYAQLASSTPDGLREALGEAGRLANVEEWIEQAVELALD